MKKIFAFVLTAICVTVFFSNSVWAQNGTIRELTGEVELKRSGSNAFVRASVGDSVSQNTIISTGFRSTAVVAVGSSLITVRPLTRLTLSEIQSAENAENINVNLQTGRVRVEVTPPAGSRTDFSVQSPSSTASVRGTIFETDGFNYSTVQGVIDVKGSGNEPVTMLSAGLSTFIDTQGTPVNPFTLSVVQSTIESIQGAREIIAVSEVSADGSIDLNVD